HPGYYVALGKVLSRLGPEQETEAVHCFEKALELKPDDIPAKFYLARAREKAGELEAARALLDEIARRFAEEHSRHAVLASIYYRLNERQKVDRESAIARKLLQSRKQPSLLDTPLE